MDAAHDSATVILGYRLCEQLHSSPKTLVYRAVRQYKSSQHEPDSVVIKVIRPPYITSEALAQFQHQYAIAQPIEHPGIIRLYRLEPYRNGYALLMEDFGGISLRQYAETRSLTLVDVFEIARQLADSLHALYQHRVIHKNIQPANILIHPETRQVKLIDFSLASTLPAGSHELPIPQGLEGTLAYLSPEQTGRMNRGIDYRADFYALGVTCYELVTGQLPFHAEEPIELVHSHLAKPAVAPHIIKPDVPLLVSELILKLMAKNAEDRYQSALGLKADLDICLHQLKTTGQIWPFELGQHDVCDRLLIPDKLYGRDTEIHTILAAFDRIAGPSETHAELDLVDSPSRPAAALKGRELVLIAGSSGIGKTAIVQEVYKPIVQRHGRFIKGKFDQFQRNIPLSAFIQAFHDLIEQLLAECDTYLAQWKHKILAALSDNAQVMIEVIPELEHIIGAQPLAPTLSASAAQNRFNLLFQQFIQVFATAEHPLVIFIDDLQWADDASLQLMQLLLSGSETQHLLLIGAYREGEVSPAHPLTQALHGLRQQQVSSTHITLTPLQESHLNQWLADTLSCALSHAKPLTHLIYQKTSGNPFFSAQFLKALYDDGLITFNHERGHWQCDITQVKTRAAADDVVQLIALRVQKLPLASQTVMQVAACIGNQFDLETLAIASQHSLTETASALWPAMQEGLIVPTHDIYKFHSDNGPDRLAAAADEDRCSILPNSPVFQYRFLHDRVQQAVCSLVPEPQKPIIHLQISQRLLANISEAELEEKLFDIVNRLNYGVELITQPHDRERLMHLNKMAGRKAKTTIAYRAAMDYFAVAMQLLPETSWQTQYSLTLELYEDAIEAAYLCGDFEQMDRWKETLLAAATTILDKIKTYEIQITAYVAQKQFREAIAIALMVLRQLGIELPQQPGLPDWLEAIQGVNALWADRPIAQAIDLPLMNDPTSQAALRILLSIDAPAYLSCPALLPLTICQQVTLSLTFGNMAESAKAYANYGLLLCSGLGDLETGYQFGELALQMLEKLEAKEIYARTSFLVNFFIRHWKEPLCETLTSLQEAYAIALKTGDLIHAAIAAEKYCYHAYFAGNALPQLAQEMQRYGEKMVQLKQEVALSTHEIHWQAVLNLMGDAQDPCRLVGQVCNEIESLPLHHQNNARTALYYLYFNKLLLCYVFHDYDQALENASAAEQYLDGGSGQFICALFYFYDSLTQLAVYPDQEPERQTQIVTRVAANQEKLNHWAQHAPINFQHKYDLVEAERQRVLGNKAAAIEYYDAAIQGAKTHPYVQEEALAQELAARFYLDWGKEKIAQSYALDAYYSYMRWGATAKMRDLEARYAHWLLPILHPQPLTLHAAEAIAPSSQTVCPLHPNAPATCSNPSALATLDCAAIFKASQALSSEIHLDKLLTTLLNTVIAHAGASKCVLMLVWEHCLRVEAVTQLGHEPKILQALPVDDSGDIPISLIYMVKHHLKPIVVDEATKAPFLLADSYILQQQPKSLLCTPILNQGKLIGILYLENHQTTGAFTQERVEILNFLCCQAAISLENARLYEHLKDYSHQLEMKVAERTAELEKANQELYRIATLDGLTLVANRRYFDSYLQEQWHRLMLVKQPLALLLCDIDYFKYYNDYYGHQAGDECLKQVAHLLTLIAKRPDDLVARYGGEEFAIVLPNTHEQGAQQVAGRIRSETQHVQLPHAQSPIAPYITLSVGVSTIIPSRDTHWETLIATADQALYNAKKSGRNRYCIYGYP